MDLEVKYMIKRENSLIAPTRYLLENCVMFLGGQICYGDDIRKQRKTSMHVYKIDNMMVFVSCLSSPEKTNILLQSFDDTNEKHRKFIEYIEYIKEISEN